jgi:hypothetical protein
MIKFTIGWDTLPLDIPDFLSAAMGGPLLTLILEIVI